MKFSEFQEASEASKGRFYDRIHGDKENKNEGKLKRVPEDRSEDERAPTDKDKAFDALHKRPNDKDKIKRDKVDKVYQLRKGDAMQPSPPDPDDEEYAFYRKKFPYKKGEDGKELKKKYETEHMNFTDYIAAGCEPIYEVKGALPKCPPGYRYSAKEKQCVPKTEKDDVRANKGGNRDSNPSNSPNFNVWGRTGVNGDGYAYAEPNNWEGDYYNGPSGGYYNE